MGPVGLRSVVLDSVALDAKYLRPTGWESLLHNMQNFTDFQNCYLLF